MSVLVDQDEKYNLDYAIQSELKDELSNCSFSDAENGYLCLKLRRNRVAHNYMDGLSDTFADLQKFYNKAVIFVVALEETIDSLTISST